jgi:hypothetical protein
MTEPGSTPGRDKFSESTLKLSERYGIDPARLDAILGKPKEVAPSVAAVEPTREWIEERRIHQPNIDASTRPKEPIREPMRDPVKIVDPVIGTSAGSTPTRKVKDVRIEGSSLAGNSRNERTYTYQKQGTSPLTWIIGVVILGLFAIAFFAMRGCEDKPAQQAQTPTTVIDTVVKTDTLATTDTVTVPVESPAATPAKPATNRPRTRRAGAASSSARNVALSTTSSFSAQEKLAELKADGNKNAKIQRVTKNGVTLYQVKTR